MGEYKDGVPNGYGTMSFPDGRNYVGKLKNGSYWCGTEYDKNGNVIAIYSEGKRQGQGVTTHVCHSLPQRGVGITKRLFTMKRALPILLLVFSTDNENMI